ncbi:endolytic transglycosylase MltG [Terasakiella sp. A23]|uniref:endolytic transglycosylase MltG n=1 Tax=Terasakiella sp. FCG-A23 TaxID=3080561 RepID=UPI002955376E|nr:endolytic transglycosylase MltG [Terasakiella sp. A23]MDV7340625.1 endolytic transglycosylase MltG [Terasakiella sp. A23]
MSEAEEAPKKKKQKNKPKSSFKKVSAFLVGFIVVAVFAGSAFSFWLAKGFTRSWVLQEDKVVVIPSGSGVARIATILHDEGIIADPLAFRIVLRFNKLDKGLKAGEYLFPAKVTPKKVARILEEGKTVLHRVTFPEGLTSVEMIGLLNGEEGLDDLVLQTPAEGTLLPETYTFSRGMKRSQVVDQMQRAMSKTLDELWAKRQDGLPLKNKQEALILASIVEKETGVSSERGKVAGVFINRLNKRMRLQTDPTVVYGITLGQEPLGRPLSKKDLKTPTPYNTYTNFGLPPTPITNPGRASLEAVMNPTETKALYFVADGTGGHAFANSLKEHNRNVSKWRRIERSRKAN